MWCVKIKRAKHSSPAQAGAKREQVPEPTTAREGDTTQKPRDMGQQKELAGGVLQRCSMNRNWGGSGRGGRELLQRQGAPVVIKGSLHFFLQRVWGGDGHLSTLPSCRAHSGDTRSIPVPSTNT